LRHANRVDRTHMAVGVQDQFAAVAVPLPLRDHLYVNASSIQRVMNMRRNDRCV
jgi:hypothetical protein